jgi:hypothetical protein
MASLSDILASLQNGVTGINNLAATLARVIPGATALSSAVPPVGTITFTSSQATGFISVVTSSGYSGKIPVY